MINVIVNSDSRYPVDKLAVQAAVMDVLQKHSITGDIEIGVSIVGDRKMHEINKKYRGLDSTANILSFALEDPVSMDPFPVNGQLQHIKGRGFVKSPDKMLRIGDILISFPQVIKDAANEGTTVEAELRFLVEHGTNHLLGFHHD